MEASRLIAIYVSFDREGLVETIKLQIWFKVLSYNLTGWI